MAQSSAIWWNTIVTWGEGEEGKLDRGEEREDHTHTNRSKKKKIGKLTY